MNAKYFRISGEQMFQPTAAKFVNLATCGEVVTKEWMSNRQAAYDHWQATGSEEARDVYFAASGFGVKKGQ